MPSWNSKHTDEEIVTLIEQLGVDRASQKLGVNKRGLQRRRKRIEAKLGKHIVSPFLGIGHKIRQEQNYPHRIPLEVKNGVVVVAGDAHYWPGDPSLMHRALVKMLKRFRDERILRAIIINGDATDFGAISRWPLVNWEKRPTVQDEIEVCQDRLDEIAKAAGRVPKLWPAGNHDLRFNLFLAEHAPEFAKVAGTHLKDHFPAWEPCWSVEINKNTIVKHRYRTGVHAVHNNLMNSGVNIITSHLHSAQVRPFTDYTGTIWGVDCGCIADVNSPAFLYLEDNPRNWREAFAVLTFVDGELLQPELVLKYEQRPGCVQFRGEIIKVS